MPLDAVFREYPEILNLCPLTCTILTAKIRQILNLQERYRKEIKLRYLMLHIETTSICNFKSQRTVACLIVRQLVLLTSLSASERCLSNFNR
jgi:hypothetical protein